MLIEKQQSRDTDFNMDQEEKEDYLAEQEAYAKQCEGNCQVELNGGGSNGHGRAEFKPTMISEDCCGNRCLYQHSTEYESIQEKSKPACTLDNSIQSNVIEEEEENCETELDMIGNESDDDDDEANSETIESIEQDQELNTGEALIEGKMNSEIDPNCEDDIMNPIICTAEPLIEMSRNDASTEDVLTDDANEDGSVMDVNSSSLLIDHSFDAKVVDCPTNHIEPFASTSSCSFQSIDLFLVLLSWFFFIPFILIWFLKKNPKIIRN